MTNDGRSGGGRRYAVVGPGAVGLAIGNALLASGNFVHFVGREASVRALRERGCARTGLFGDVAVAPERLRASSELAALGRDDEAALDAILVATKTHSGHELASALGSSALAGRDLPLVLFMNGLGNAERFAEHWEPSRIYNARVITGFRRRDAASVEVTVHADAIAIGSLFEGADPGVASTLASALDAGGLPSRFAPEIERDLWAKALYNAALNPLGAILGVPYGVLGDLEPTRRIMRALTEEAFAVIDATGARTHWPDADAFLRDFYAKSLPPTRAHESSMLQDVRAGRPTEIDAICGAIAERGRAAGVATPTLDVVIGLVRALEAQGATTAG